MENKVEYTVYAFACIFAWVRNHDGSFVVDHRYIDTFKEHYPDAVEIGREKKE
jgi:hypothetical protein